MVAIEKLENLGLTRNEAKVYRSLIEIGETKTGAVVKDRKSTRLNSSH